MSHFRPIAVPPPPSHWPGLVVMIRPVDLGFLLRLTD